MQLANDKNLGKVHFVEEKVLSRISWRDRAIGPLLEQEMVAGDVLLISEISRLGRSMLEIMEILNFALTKEIRVYSVKGSGRSTEQSK